MKSLNRQTCNNTLYPERIIQFGEGNFLRGFADWIIQKMNERIAFNSGVVVVQPLPNGMIDTLNEQDGLYHVNLQGIDKNEKVDTVEMIDVVSRALNPYSHFEEYLQLAECPDIQFVISNTTEAGIVFDPTCKFDDRPAKSYPGKLTQLLYRRYQTFKEDKNKGWIIFPCELIFHNGRELKKCIDQYIELWKLDSRFREWLDETCSIHNTLVDRIVPGYPKDSVCEISARINVDDKMLVKAEIFHLWVIEASKSIEERFPASQAGLNVLFVPNEQAYHERKVSLLNAPHTVLSPVAYLSGLDTVRECVEDPMLGVFVRKMVFEELIPTLDLPITEKEGFANDVLIRFRNPFIKHFVKGIMLNSFSKYKTRVLPRLKEYLIREGHLPMRLVLGLAAIVIYYRGGKRGDDVIVPVDSRAVLTLLSELWTADSLEKVATGVLGAEFIWDEDLNKIPDLSRMLTSLLTFIQEKGMLSTVRAL
ncbi:MAG: tagaturonate reductase [Bacteroidales bacterium]